MNIALPKVIDERKGENGAYIEDGILYIGKNEFEKIMYQLTYQMKGEICHYCGKVLTRKTRSIDHLYPQDTGGISITNNLEPCCKSCNGLKGNLNEEDFKRYRHLLKENPKRKEEFLEGIAIRRSEIRKTFGVDLPSKWYSLCTEYDVLTPIQSADQYKASKGYIKIRDLYEVYGRICKTVVVSGNGILVDGFKTLMFAKNLEFTVEVPIVRLENVIVY